MSVTEKLLESRSKVISSLVGMREDVLSRSRNKLIYFTQFIKPDYIPNWHHKLIASKLDDFLNNKTKNRLMLFVPPQHGKSELASRNFPAYVLGKYPRTKIAAISYSIDLARSFNRDVQRTIDTEEYREVFPEVKLNSKNTVTDRREAYLRNSEEFETVTYRGSYKSVGVMGGLSGRAVDIAIIDDPVKDALEANSETYRERVWEWYLNVLSTRLHNKSKVILIMTRWHEDDLAGRLLEMEPHKWDVIKIPAIKEKDGMPEDPRQIGDPLWPEKHSLEKLLDLRKLSETTFTSLYQQEPTIQGGNKIKDEWFEYCEEKEVPGNLIWDMWIDGAYTKQTENDPSGIIVCAHAPRLNRLYIRYAHDDYLEMPQMLELVPNVFEAQEMAGKSMIRIEPKASGKSLVQMLRLQRLSVAEITGHLVSEGKEARCSTAAPKFESRQIYLVRGAWNERFKKQLTGFPKAKHDEYVDLIGYACHHYFDRKRAGGVKRRN